MTTIIDVLIARHEEIKAFFETHNEISLKVDRDDEFRKVLVLSIASFFEYQIIDAVSRLAASTHSEQVESFIKNKAIKRQYHTYFNWKGNNANQFLGLFGEDFKNRVSKEIRDDSSLAQGCKSFLQLGDERNRLVHENFANASVEKTLQEIIELYRQALVFIEYIAEKIQPEHDL